MPCTAIDYRRSRDTTATEPSAALVTVEIDGIPVAVPEAPPLMRAAALAGVRVPKLCAPTPSKHLAHAVCA